LLASIVRRWNLVL